MNWPSCSLDERDRMRRGIVRGLSRLPSDWYPRAGTVANQDGYIEDRAVTRQVLMKPKVMQVEPSTTRKAAQR